MGKIVLSGTTKYILFFVVLILLLSLLNFDGVNGAFTQDSGVQLTGSENHTISLDDAVSLTKRYREKAPPGSVLGEYFGREAVQKVLDQTDCIGLRIYYGEDEEGTPKMVVVGVNVEEEDMTDGLILEYGFLCPPICSYTSPLVY